MSLKKVINKYVINYSMKTNQECVLEFTNAFNMFTVPYGQYSRELLIENPKTSKLRYDLIHEEYNELLDAFSQKNFIEVIDALTDILYVTYGAGVSLGIDLDKSFPLLIKKLLKKDFDSTKTHFENTLGSYSLRKEDIKKNIFNEGRESEINSIMVFTKTLDRDLELLYKILIEFNQTEKLEETLNKINYKVYSLGVLLKINLDTSFDIVHRSNMSKVCEDEDTAILTVENYKKNDDRYDSPVMYKLDDGRYIVRNFTTGKALKSIKYTPACFKTMLNIE